MPAVESLIYKLNVESHGACYIINLLTFPHPNYFGCASESFHLILGVSLNVVLQNIYAAGLSLDHMDKAFVSLSDFL